MNRQPSTHPIAEARRREKSVAMIRVIDADFRKQFPGQSEYDQAGRILIAAMTWDDATWEQIGTRAGYKPKPISGRTRDLVRAEYRARATAPIREGRLAS